MEFHGSNAALGAETVELTERRSADPLVQVDEEQPLFPGGLGGLVPIRTLKANGVESVTYAFPFGEGVVADEEPSEGDEENAGEDGAAPADEYGDDVPRVEATPETQPVLDALLDAVDLVNGLLGQASELSGYTFGQVCAIQVGVTQLGVGFTRVEPFPADKDKAQSEVALTLHIETTDQMPGTTESFSAVVDYDDEGQVVRVAMLEYTGDGYVFRAAANIDEKTGELSIHKVERIDRTVHTERLLYKRGRQDRPRVDDPQRREPRERRGYDRRGGWDDRDERRGGYDRRDGGYREDRGGYRGRDERGGRGGFGGRDSRDFDRGGYRDERGGRYDCRDDRRGPRDYDRDGRGGRGGFGGRDDRYARDDRRDGGFGGRPERGGYREDRPGRGGQDGYRGRDDRRDGFDRGPSRYSGPRDRY